jgi:PAS domain S-box-containing protein
MTPSRFPRPPFPVSDGSDGAEPAERHPATLDGRRFRALVTAFADFVWATDPAGRLLYDLRPWREITGQTADELLGYGWLEGVHPDDRARVEATWHVAVTEGTPYAIAYRLVGPDGGRWLDLRGAPVVGEDGEVQEWIGTAVDVTEQRAARDVEHRLQAELESERRMLEEIVARAPMAVAVLRGPSHEFRLFNERYLDLVPPGRVRIGMTVADALPEAEVAIPLLDRVLAGEIVALSELGIPFDDERSYRGHRHYDIVYTPILEAGLSVGVLVTATEVTETVRRRDDLERQLLEERLLAEQLQHALLPEGLPEIDGLSFAVRYLPAGEGVGVGGDWYDVVALADGRVMVTIGDVCGRGLGAATVMSQVRSAIRAYALEDPEPASVLARVARFVDDLGLPDMITAAVGLVDRAGGTLTLANAGHLAPVLLTPGAAPSLLPVALDPPLGAGRDAYRSVTVPFGPGSMLALYTDGVVERRDLSIAATLEELRSAAEAGARTTAAELCETLTAYARRDGGIADDAALLICAVDVPERPAA